MTIRRTIPLYIGVSLLTIMAISYGLAHVILLRSFSALEQRDAHIVLARALGAISDDLSELDTRVADWAKWNDCYAFMGGVNPHFIQRNILDETFRTLRVNAMVFLDTTGSPVEALGFDPARNQPIEVDKHLIDYLHRNEDLLHHDPTDFYTGRSGFVSLADEPVLLSAWPILTGDGRGPARGTLIMARKLTATMMLHIGNRTGATFAIRDVSAVADEPEWETARRSLSGGSGIEITADGTMVAAHAVIPDLSGSEALIARVEVPRTIYHEAQRSMWFLMSALGIAALIFAIIGIALSERLILAKLSRLCEDVRRIGRRGEASTRLESHGNDELAELAKSINSMLDALQSSYATLQESEDRFRRMANGIGDGLSIVEHGRIVYVNDRLCMIVGYAREELLGLTDVDFAVPEERARIEAIIKEAKKRDTMPRELEFWIQRKDGTRRCVQNRYSLSRDGDRITGRFVVTTDITERKEAERELERLKQFNERIVQRMAEGIAVDDTQGRYTFVNPAAAAMLGYAVDELVGQPWSIVVPEDQRPTVEEANRRRRDGTSDRYELEVVRKDGSRRVMLVSACPRFEDDQFMGTIAVFTDITEERQTQRRIQDAERLAAIGELAAGIAHDFNNILSSIIGFSQLLLRMRELPLSARESITTIADQGQRASQLVRQILDFSRQSFIELRPLELSRFMEDTAALLRRTIPEHIRVIAECEPGSYWINASVAKLQRILMNLAFNARDAMPAGGDLTLRLSYFRLDPGGRPPIPDMSSRSSWAMLRVSDTGCGIAPAHLPRVFQPFFTTKDVGQGTGLGLAQAYGLVTQHRGHIRVETEIEKGTTFTIYLPLIETPDGETMESELPPTTPGKGETILLVEDDPAVLDVGTAMLEQAGYHVMQASSGSRALQLYEEHGNRISLILTDMVMPGMDGVTLVERLTARDSGVRVLVVSGYPLDETSRRRLGPCCVGWLEKPFVMERLMHAVASALRSPRHDH